MPINTISDMQVVSYNKYLVSENMKDPARVEEEFKWARTAPEAKLVNKMESDFLERVKMVKKQALRAKETMKQKNKKIH